MPVINKALKIEDLPPPPLGKTGWPWTEKSDPVPDRMPDGSMWPLISIVTPSYNQGQFIEETIRSVLLQGYPNLEYIIIDGGSTDETLEIIKKYENHLAYWVSEPDRGQSHAINKGFAKATGQTFNWINSDDWFEKNSFSLVAEIFTKEINTDVIYGTCLMTDDVGKVKKEYPTGEFSLSKLIERNFIGQPTVFWRGRVWHQHGELNESLDFALDYDLWLRWSLEKLRFRYISNLVAYYRGHDKSKSSKILVHQRESIPLVWNLYKSGKIEESKIHFDRRLYANCLYSYAVLDLSEFWYFLRQYLKTSKKMPDFLLLYMVLTALLGGKILGYIRQKKRNLGKRFSIFK